MEVDDLQKRFNYEPGDRVKVAPIGTRYDGQIGLVDSCSGGEPDENGASKLWSVRVRFPDGWCIMFAARELESLRD